jgi:hypothetical protein
MRGVDRSRKLTSSGSYVQDLVRVIPYRGVEQGAVRQLEDQSVLHVLSVLLDIIVGDRIFPIPVVMISFREGGSSCMSDMSFIHVK